MRLKQWATGIGLGALAATGLVVAPALQAQNNRAVQFQKRDAAASPFGIAVFTPAAADPKLAAVLARSGLPDTGFGFTPSESRGDVSKPLAVSMRSAPSRSAAAAATVDRSVTAPTGISISPIAYNLGLSVGWKRFSISNEATKIDLVPQSAGTDRSDLSVAYMAKHPSSSGGSKVSAVSDRALPGTPALIGADPGYSIDVGGSYSLTKNFDVTAGLRYKADRERLPRLTEERRDSQAVYVGTAFRF